MANLTGFQRDNAGLYIVKDPQANVQYGLDFTDYLQTGHTVSSAVVTIQSITGDASPLAHPTNAATDVVVTNPVVNIRLHNGTAGNIYNIRCKITTSYGDVDARHFRIVVKDKVL
jgi:hypothetical protein